MFFTASGEAICPSEEIAASRISASAEPASLNSAGTAAVSRRTPDGALLGEAEALTPDEALDLFLADPEDLALRKVRLKLPLERMA